MLKTMTGNARQALKQVLNLNPRDEVLVVTDNQKQQIASAFIEAAKQLGCKPNIYIIQESMRPLKEIPDKLKNDLAKKTVLINIFEARNPEIPFRVNLCLMVDKIEHLRMAHSPGITEEMMISGSMSVDYSAMKKDALALMENFKGATAVQIYSQAGTDLHLGIKNRSFKSDVQITPQSPGNLPCGEIYCAPEEEKANGKLVIDASIGNLGVVTHPIEIIIKEGMIISISSKEQTLADKLIELTSIDHHSKVIGEFGVGLNPQARITGNMLEDEKAAGTAHIAFGNNLEMPGGQNSSQIHRDLLFFNPTLEIINASGDRQRVVQDLKIKKK